MKIPDKLILLGEIIDVIQLSSEESKCEHCGDEWAGKYVPDEKKIYIRVGDDNNPPLESILHELGHYFMNYYGIGLDEFPAEAYAKFTESIIKQLKLK